MPPSEVSSGKTRPRAPSEGAFDCLRLLAAVGVLFSHCYPLLDREDGEPFLRLTGLSLGTLAVYVFFAISGYLVTQSWMRDPSVGRFMQRRTLRIFPALVFVIAASFAVLGPLTTDLAPGDYFTRAGAWSYLAKIFIYPGQYGLPGVFTHNPFPEVVNGSLWTLRLEFGLYIVVAILGMAGFLRRRGTGAALVLSCLAAALLLEHAGASGLPHQLLDFFLNAVPFFFGMAFAQTGIDVKRCGILSLALMAAAAVLYPTPFFDDALLLALSSATLFLAHHGQCHLGRFGDYSYGLYLWGFPVEQAILHFSGPMPVASLFLRAALATFALAFVSWHLVEKRALQLKPRRKAP